jgi:hypothetical protein
VEPRTPIAPNSTERTIVLRRLLDAKDFLARQADQGQNVSRPALNACIR